MPSPERPCRRPGGGTAPGESALRAVLLLADGPGEHVLECRQTWPEMTHLRAHAGGCREQLLSAQFRRQSDAQHITLHLATIESKALQPFDERGTVAFNPHFEHT